MNRNRVYILLLLLFLYWYNKKNNKAKLDEVDPVDPRLPCWRWADGSSYEDGFYTSPPATSHPDLQGDWRMYYYCCDDFSVCAESQDCAYNVGFYWVANSDDPNKNIQEPTFYSPSFDYGIHGQPKSNKTNNQMSSTMNGLVIQNMITQGIIPSYAYPNPNTWISTNGSHANHTSNTFVRPTSIRRTFWYNMGKSSGTIQYHDVQVNHNFLVGGVRNITNQSGATPTYTELNKVQISFDYEGLDGSMHTYTKVFDVDIDLVCGGVGRGIVLGGS